jgi:hypothetical protein
VGTGPSGDQRWALGRQAVHHSVMLLNYKKIIWKPCPACPKKLFNINVSNVIIYYLNDDENI